MPRNLEPPTLAIAIVRRQNRKPTIIFWKQKHCRDKSVFEGEVGFFYFFEIENRQPGSDYQPNLKICKTFQTRTTTALQPLRSVQQSRCSVQRSGCSVQQSRCSVQQSRCSVQRSGCSVQLSRCSVQQSHRSVQQSRCSDHRSRCWVQHQFCFFLPLFFFLK